MDKCITLSKYLLGQCFVADVLTILGDEGIGIKRRRDIDMKTAVTSELPRTCTSGKTSGLKIDLIGDSEVYMSV